MKRKLAFASIFLMAIATLLSSAPAAYADTVSLTLLNPTQSAMDGQTLSFYATVSADSSNTGIEYLNGDYFSVTPPTTLDDTSFQYFPFSLAPGQSYTGLLFTIFLPTSTPVGFYYPGVFTITGGSTDSSTDALATATFTAGATPEPSTFLLLGSGILILAFYIKRQESISLT